MTLEVARQSELRQQQARVLGTEPMPVTVVDDNERDSKSDNENTQSFNRPQIVPVDMLQAIAPQMSHHQA